MFHFTSGLVDLKPVKCTFAEQFQVRFANTKIDKKDKAREWTKSYSIKTFESNVFLVLRND